MVCNLVSVKLEVGLCALFKAHQTMTAPRRYYANPIRLAFLLWLAVFSFFSVSCYRPSSLAEVSRHERGRTSNVERFCLACNCMSCICRSFVCRCITEHKPEYSVDGYHI